LRVSALLAVAGLDDCGDVRNVLSIPSRPRPASRRAFDRSITSGTKLLNKDFGFFNGVFAYGRSTQLLNSQFPPEELAFQKVMNARKTLPVAPPFPFTADEQEEANLWGTPLTDYVTQNALKFILGQRDLSQWDAYVSELKGKNSQQYIDLVNKAQQRFQKDHG
jgi:putative aldouronate transport system substrate-binding protein